MQTQNVNVFISVNKPIIDFWLWKLAPGVLRFQIFMKYDCWHYAMYKWVTDQMFVISVLYSNMRFTIHSEATFTLPRTERALPKKMIASSFTETYSFPHEQVKFLLGKTVLRSKLTEHWTDLPAAEMFGGVVVKLSNRVLTVKLGSIMMLCQKKKRKKNTFSFFNCTSNKQTQEGKKYSYIYHKVILDFISMFLHTQYNINVCDWAAVL